MAPLKPCPFCGSPAMLNSRDFNDWNQCASPSDGYWVVCTKTDCILDITEVDDWDAYSTPEDAIEAWNKRATDNVIQLYGEIVEELSLHRNILNNHILRGEKRAHYRGVVSAMQWVLSRPEWGDIPAWYAVQKEESNE